MTKPTKVEAPAAAGAGEKEAVKYLTATGIDMRNPYSGQWFRSGSVTKAVEDGWVLAQKAAGLLVEDSV